MRKEEYRIGLSIDKDKAPTLKGRSSLRKDFDTKFPSVKSDGVEVVVSAFIAGCFEGHLLTT
jgi:hypothetical protein